MNVLWPLGLRVLGGVLQGPVWHVLQIRLLGLVLLRCRRHGLLAFVEVASLPLNP